MQRGRQERGFAEVETIGDRTSRRRKLQEAKEARELDEKERAKQAAIEESLSGTLLGIASTGVLLVPRLGSQRTALLGGLLSACFVVLMVVAGAVGSESLFRWALAHASLLHVHVILLIAQPTRRRTAHEHVPVVSYAKGKL